MGMPLRLPKFLKLTRKRKEGRTRVIRANTAPIKLNRSPSATEGTQKHCRAKLHSSDLEGESEESKTRLVRRISHNIRRFSNRYSRSINPENLHDYDDLNIVEWNVKIPEIQSLVETNTFQSLREYPEFSEDSEKRFENEMDEILNFYESNCNVNLQTAFA